LGPCGGVMDYWCTKKSRNQNHSLLLKPIIRCPNA